MQAIDSHAFCYVPGLKNLSLAGNRLEHIHTDFLTSLCPLVNMTTLDLQRNQIGAVVLFVGWLSLYLDCEACLDAIPLL